MQAPIIACGIRFLWAWATLSKLERNGRNMSIDGAGMLESDLAHDVYNEILDLYDADASVERIKEQVALYEAEIDTAQDSEIYLAASAKAFWEIGHLDRKLLERLHLLVESGESLRQWSAIDAALGAARKRVLTRLLLQIAVPRKSVRKRKKYKKIQAKLFSLGDCLQLEVRGAIYRGVVCKIAEYRGVCEYMMLVMAADTVSSSDGFANSYYYGHKIGSTLHAGGSISGPHVIRVDHRLLMRSGNPFRVVGKVALDESKYTPGSFGGVIELDHVITDFERTLSNPSAFRQTLLPLRELLID